MTLSQMAFDDDGNQMCAIPGCKLLVGRLDIALCYWHVDEAAALLYAAEKKQAQEAKRLAKENQRGVIYFVRVDDKIKVGYAFNIRQRLRQYPPDSEVLATRHGATPADEKALHLELTQYRVAGREWYRDCAEVRSLAAAIVAEHGKPVTVKWGDGQQRPATSRSARRTGAVVTGFAV